MKEEMKLWFQWICYENGFGPGEVSFAEVRKRLINTHVILSAVSHEEMRKIFGENEAFMLF